MKNIYSITAFLFLALLSVGFISGLVSKDFGFTRSISDLELSSGLTLQKVIDLCVQESCIITIREEISTPSYYSPKLNTITIKSHYDNRVALIISGDLLNSQIHLTTKLPYELNESAINGSCQKGYNCYPFIPKEVDPETYNWDESMRTDLTYLKDIGVLDINSLDINSIVSLNSQYVGKCKEAWVSTAGCYQGCNDEGTGIKDVIICAESDIDTTPFPELPSKEFNINTNDRNKKISNSIYWILGIVIIVVVILFLVFRKKH